MNSEIMKVVHSLTPIQAAVLRVMAAMGEAYAPFEVTTLQKYRQALILAGIPDAEARADVPVVQSSLATLQDKKLVWRATRGVYAVEEQNLVEQLEQAGLLNGLK